MLRTIMQAQGGLALEVCGGKKVVILRVLSEEEEMAKEQAMAESKFQEKH
jgi:hypothetical protein